MSIKSTFGLLILIVFLSGCINSNVPTQKTQPIITPIPTTIKIIDLHAQQLVVDENDIKEVLGQNWKTSPGGMVINVANSNPKSKVDRNYESEAIKKSGGSIQYYAMVEVVVFNTIDEAKKVRETRVNVGGRQTSETNIGDYRVQTSDGNIVIWFVKNNVLSYVWINRVLWPGPDGRLFLSETEKTEMLSIDKAINLAKKQDEKISRILEMIK